ncbi:MAG TPA: glycosyltransferase family 4 protein [Candidatus Binataceae bacterium]|nr:glycosyltransferase family 4 protein [Candidatus Binataceae bacterium]
MEKTNDASRATGGASSRPLRIAQIAPLYERVPPKLYGGTERVVSNITEELVRRGHEVTMFASGDSITRAKLSPGYPTALRLAGIPELGTFIQLPMISDVYEGAEDRFDIIHSHIDYWSFPFARLVSVPTVATMHGRLDIDDLRPIYHRYRSVPAVSISDAQRVPLQFMNWVETIYHGLPRDLLHFSPNPGKYLAFLGRISPEKRPDLAIEVARKVGIPLKMAAKVDVVDRAYFETVIEPRLSPPDIEYIGEINEVEKSEFLGNAIALMFPIDWPEPFGLTMIESMACGTPVVARPFGSVREIIKPEVSGVIASTVDEMVAAVRKAATLSRAGCRAEFEARFSADVMVDNYVRVYRRLIAQGHTPVK